MTQTLVISLIGPDRPGIVDAVAQAVAAHGGNWLESRLAHLAGRFVGIVRVAAPAEQVEALTRALGALPDLRTQVIADDDGGGTGGLPAEGPRWRVELLGHDRPGIVRGLAAALAARGVNVEELTTECFSAAMSGESMFRARATLAVPDPPAADDLADTLDAIGRELDLDVSFHEAAEPAG